MSFPISVHGQGNGVADSFSALVDLLHRRVGINLNVVDTPDQVALEQVPPPARALYHALDEPALEEHPQRSARCLLRSARCLLGAAQQVDGGAVCFHAHYPLKLAERLLGGRPALGRRHTGLVPMSRKKAPRPGDEQESYINDVVKKYENSVPHFKK